jgi:ubiquinone/menaquinone biosynthesis C-methylase UbiE
VENGLSDAIELRSMADRTKTAYEKWAATYDTDPNPHTALEYRPVLETLAARSGEKILDAACGTGRYTAALHADGVEVIGVDFSPSMLAIARSHLPQVRFMEADLNAPLPFKENAFDAVLCGQALKHLPDLAAPFSEFSRVLRSGGRLVFSVTHPDMSWAGYEMQPYTGFVVREEADIFHHRFFDYFDAAEKAGLACTRVVQLTVSEEIRHFLTEESFKRVRGRPQILILELQKGRRPVSNGSKAAT